jgi:hypothetical protein
LKAREGVRGRLMAKKAAEEHRGTIEEKTGRMAGGRKVRSMIAAGKGEFISPDRRKLRTVAEKLLKSRKARVRSEEACFKEMAEEDPEMVIQELLTYQAELEIRNEELRAAQQRIEESRSGYANL